MQEVASLEHLIEKSKQRSAPMMVSAEAIVYALLIVVTLILRLAQLDAVALSGEEAKQALSAWRSIHPLEGISPPPSASPLLFTVQSISFGLLGGTEFASRALTVLASAILVLTPLLFRERLGRGRTLILSVLLATSPSLFAASRASSPVVWSSLLVVIGLWSLYRFVAELRISIRLAELADASTEPSLPALSSRIRYGVIAIVCLLSAALLADAAGVLLLAMVAGAGAFAAFTDSRQNERVYNFEEEATERANVQVRFLDVITSLPWAVGGAIAGLIMVIVGTVFMTYPTGLGNIGDLLGYFIGGFAGASNLPIAYPFLISVYYDPFLWLFAVIAVVLTAQNRRINGVTRYMIGWVLAALLVTVVYPGARAEHSLWFTLPLAVLASDAAVAFLRREAKSVWEVPVSARWIVALAVMAILAVFTIALHDVARSLMTAGDGILANVRPDAASTVLLIIPIVFLLITYFLVASLWNERVALHGIGLGFLIFGLIGSLGSGWRIAVENAERPNEFWHMETTSQTVFLLRDTLRQVAERQSSGFNDVQIRAVAPSDGVIAWLLRDYPQTRFVNSLQEAVGAPVVIAPHLEDSTLPPSLINNYAGQDFIVTRRWLPTAMFLTEYLAWWTQRRTRLTETSVERVVVWLRADVYQGVDYVPDTAETG